MSVFVSKLSEIIKKLDLKDISDNKNLWARVKPLFSNKIKSVGNIFYMNQGR